MDAMMLTLFRLSQFYVVEVNRGRYGMSDNCLTDGVQYSGNIPDMASVPSAEEIVQRIRQSDSLTQTSTLYCLLPIKRDTYVRM